MNIETQAYAANLEREVTLTRAARRAALAAELEQLRPPRRWRFSLLHRRSTAMAVRRPTLANE
jgi:hypothetical protein